jgi:hypothetical protein
MVCIKLTTYMGIHVSNCTSIHYTMRHEHVMFKTHINHIDKICANVMKDGRVRHFVLPYRLSRHSKPSSAHFCTTKPGARCYVCHRTRPSGYISLRKTLLKHMAAMANSPKYSLRFTVAQNNINSYMVRISRVKGSLISFSQ